MIYLVNLFPLISKILCLFYTHRKKLQATWGQMKLLSKIQAMHLRLRRVDQSKNQFLRWGLNRVTHLDFLNTDLILMAMHTKLNQDGDEFFHGGVGGEEQVMNQVDAMRAPKYITADSLVLTKTACYTGRIWGQ